MTPERTHPSVYPSFIPCIYYSQHVGEFFPWVDTEDTVEKGKVSIHVDYRRNYREQGFLNSITIGSISLYQIS